MRFFCTAGRAYTCFGRGLETHLGPWLPGLLARFVFAATLYFYFLNSALTKIGEGLGGLFNLSASAYYQIALPAIDAAGGDPSQVPFLPWGLFVHLGTYAEFVLPVLIIFGIATRLSALAMIGFIAVQTFVDIAVHHVGAEAIGTLFDRFPDSPIMDQRLLWVFPLVILIIYGPGRISVDYLIGRIARKAA